MGSTSFLLAAYPVRSSDAKRAFAVVWPPRIEGDPIMGYSVRWLRCSSINLSIASRDALGGLVAPFEGYLTPSHDFLAEGHGSCVSSVVSANRITVLDVGE